MIEATAIDAYCEDRTSDQRSLSARLKFPHVVGTTFWCRECERSGRLRMHFAHAFRNLSVEDVLAPRLAYRSIDVTAAVSSGFRNACLKAEILFHSWKQKTTENDT